MKQPILAIETTGTYCSVALVDDGQCFYKESERKRSHADDLLSSIDHLLSQASVALVDCAAIAVNLGPGSFTGIRIGIAVAQGLAFGADIKTCAVSALQAMVMDASHGAESVYSAEAGQAGGHDDPGETVWLALLHAREDEFYFAEYRLNTSGYPVLVDKECVIREAAIIAWWHDRNDNGDQRTVFVGEAWERIQLSEVTVVPATVNAKTVAQVASYKLDDQATLEPADLVPSYLKDEMHYRTVSDDNQPA